MESQQISDVERIRGFLSGLRNVSRARKNQRFVRKVKDDFGFDDIEFGEPLKEIPQMFKTDVLSFVGYIEEKKRMSFEVIGKKGEEITKKVLPYVHRWTALYRRGILAKLYQLETFLGYDVDQVTMITLTTFQRGEDPEKCLLRLLQYYNRLFKIFRKCFGTQDYFYILEPHQTGYAHMHIMYMKAFTDAEKDKIKSLWSRLYGMGSYEHGVHFSEPRSSSNGAFTAGSIAHVRGYLMKYISKGLHSESMSYAELLFNALIRKHKIRLWGCSRNFSAVMKKPVVPESQDWECTEIRQYYNEEFVGVYWSKEYGLKPGIIKVWKYVISLPMIFKSDLEKEKLGQIKIEYDKLKNVYSIFEPVWVPVACV